MVPRRHQGGQIDPPTPPDEHVSCRAADPDDHVSSTDAEASTARGALDCCVVVGRCAGCLSGPRDARQEPDRATCEGRSAGPATTRSAIRPLQRELEPRTHALLGATRVSALGQGRGTSREIARWVAHQLPPCGLATHPALAKWSASIQLKALITTTRGHHRCRRGLATGPLGDSSWGQRGSGLAKHDQGGDEEFDRLVRSAYKVLLSRGLPLRFTDGASCRATVRTARRHGGRSGIVLQHDAHRSAAELIVPRSTMEPDASLLSAAYASQTSQSGRDARPQHQRWARSDFAPGPPLVTG